MWGSVLYRERYKQASGGWTLNPGQLDNDIKGKRDLGRGNTAYKGSGAFGIWQDKESKHIVLLGIKRDTGQPHSIQREKPHQFKQGQYEGNRNKRNSVGSS